MNDGFTSIAHLICIVHIDPKCIFGRSWYRGILVSRDRCIVNAYVFGFSPLEFCVLVCVFFACSLVSLQCHQCKLRKWPVFLISQLIRETESPCRVVTLYIRESGRLGGGLHRQHGKIHKGLNPSHTV